MLSAEEKKLDDEETTRQLTKRELAFLSPRLGILNNIPFAIPFESRVSIFRSFIRNDQFEMENSGYGLGTSMYRKKVIVRRENVSQDGFDHLNELGAAWKGRLSITFVDKFGQEVCAKWKLSMTAHVLLQEAGIDGGGVFKEFLTSLSREVFDTNRGLWLATKQQELYPNSHSYAKERMYIARSTTIADIHRLQPISSIGIASLVEYSARHCMKGFLSMSPSLDFSWPR
jgi:ubiquitin-protein ligase E3 C